MPSGLAEAYRIGMVHIIISCRFDNVIPGVSPRYPSDVLEISRIGGKSEAKRDISVLSQGRLLRRYWDILGAKTD